MPVKGLVSRKSPFGYPEIVVPPGLEQIEFAFDPKAVAFVNPPISLLKIPPIAEYRSQYADDPVVQTHERMHVGQFLQPVAPSREDVEKALTPWKRYGGAPYTDAMEPPAYTFSEVEPSREFRRKQQESYNNYIDLIYRLNPKASFHVEAPTPIPLQQEYVKRHPRPMLPPKVDMKERGILSSILGR